MTATASPPSVPTTPSTRKAPAKSANAAKISVFALAMLNIVAVVSLRGLPVEAEYGLGAIFYYLFAAVFFLIPMSLVAAELATGWPEKGGVFRWVGEAFGGRWAFLAMCMLFIEVSIWFPTAITFGAVALAYIGTNKGSDGNLAGNSMFVLLVVLVVYWLATFIALRGAKAFARVAKWGGMIGTIVPAAILIGLGFAYVIAGNKPQISTKVSSVMPNFSHFSNVVLAASIFLFYAGMEMNAIHVKEVKNPTRDYPIAVLIAAVGTVVIFVLGTLAVAFIVPHSDINLTQSLLTAYNDLFAWAGISWAGSVVAAMLAVGVFSGVVTWIAGPSSGLLTVGKAGFLPRFFQKTNKNGMGTNIMLVQAGVVTLLSVLFVVLPSVQSVYQILSQLTVILYLVMYLLMFAAAIYLRHSQADRPRPYRVPGGRIGMWIVAGCGFIASLGALALSFVPPNQIKVGSSAVFVGLLVVLTALFVGGPFLIYRARKTAWLDPGSDFAPFTWQGDAKHPDPPTKSADAAHTATPHPAPAS
jgi:putative glutamate/gamma-aminobutyrate antiporter